MATPQRNSQQGKPDVLAQCQRTLTDFCKAQNETFASIASEYLFKHAEKSSNNESQRSLFEARQLLSEYQGTLEQLICKSIEQRFTSFQNPIQKSPGANSEKDLSTENSEEQPLGLIDNDEMEIQVAFTSMGHRAEADCADLLFALGQRTALLNNGNKLNDEQSPYAPKHFCDCLKDTIDLINKDQPIDVPVQLILIKLFDRHFIRHLSTVYKTINDQLVENNVLPNLRYGGQRKSPQQQRRRKSDSIAEQSEIRQSELVNTIQELLQAAPAQLNPTLPVIPVDQLVSELGRFQTQQLAQLQMLQAAGTGEYAQLAAAPQLPNSNAKMSQHAIECVGVLFECILNDDQLPDSIKALLSHLHTPLLKVALLEEDFLSNTDHPARQLLTTLIDAGERWVAPDCTVKNDVYPRMQALVKRLIVEFENDTSLFSNLLDEFNEHLHKIERKASITEERNLQAAKGKEQLKERRAEVDALIQEKLGDEPLPKPVVEMLAGPWAAFLAFLLLRHGRDSQVFEEAQAVIDDILWYIEPKVDSAETQLAEKMRGNLHRRIEDGLTSVGREPADIQNCIHALEMCKKLATENVDEQYPADDKAAHFPTHSNSDNHNTDHHDKSADTVEKQPDTPAMQQNSTGALTSLAEFREQEHEQSEKMPREKISAIEAQRRKRASNAVPQKLIDDVMQMDFGTWLDWNKAGESAKKLKLTWYNRNTQNCMLANQMGQQVAIVSASEIATGIRDGWIKVAKSSGKKPFFEKMLETVAQQLRSRAKSA